MPPSQPEKEEGVEDASVGVTMSGVAHINIESPNDGPGHVQKVNDFFYD